MYTEDTDGRRTVGGKEQPEHIRYVQLNMANLVGDTTLINKKGHVQDACSNALNCVPTSGIGLRGGVFVLQLPETPIAESILQQQPENNSRVLLRLFMTIAPP